MSIFTRRLKSFVLHLDKKTSQQMFKMLVVFKSVIYKGTYV